MKDSILKVAEHLENGTIDSNKARSLLLNLFGVSGSLPLTIDNVNKIIKKASKETWIAVQCVKMDGIPMNTSEENWLKHSAICIGIAENYRDETFELFWTDEKGFSVRLSKSGMKIIRYDDYKLEDNVLTWVGRKIPRT